MKAVKVFYFASLREIVGKSEDRFLIETPTSAQSLWDLLNAGVTLPVSSLVAINHEYADLQTMVHEGDEVAFFPPVTGG